MHSVDSVGFLEHTLNLKVEVLQAARGGPRSKNGAPQESNTAISRSSNRSDAPPWPQVIGGQIHIKPEGSTSVATRVRSEL